MEAKIDSLTNQLETFALIMNKSTEKPVGAMPSYNRFKQDGTCSLYVLVSYDLKK